MMLHNYKSALVALVLSMVLISNVFAVEDEYKYVVILQSTPKNYSLKDASLPIKYRSTQYKLFLSKVTLNNNKVRYRLKLGFFKTKREADEASESVKAKYSRAWVSNMSNVDNIVLLEWQKSKTAKKDKTSKFTKSNVIFESNSLNDKKIMQRAKKAMTSKNYRVAIGLYTKIVSAGNSEYHKQALEFLGVAREKNNQFIHARAEYKNYLKLYPDGEDATRVKQRLLALETILLRPKDKLKKSDSKFSDWQNFGSFSQFYRRDTTTSTDNRTNTSTEAASSTISSVFTYISRKRSDSLNIRSQLTASHLYYLDNPSQNDRGRINIMFVDFSDAANNKSIRLGRQSQNRGGVLGRMDGIWLEYRLSPLFKVNLVGGYPVNTTLSNNLEKNKPFSGISFDVSNEQRTVDYNFYTIDQKVDSITDRNAVGAEIRYHKDKQNHFLTMDYDVYFKELNTLYFVGNWRFENDASLVATLNYRNSPILTTSNALVGQGTLTIENLLASLSENEIKKIAQQRTTRYSSASISSYFKLSKVWDLNLDATVAKLDASASTPANPPVVEVLGAEGTGNEYYYSMQFLSNNLFKFDEVNNIQVTRIDAKTYKKVLYSVSSSFKYNNNKWRFRPKLSYEERVNTSGTKIKRFIPAIRIDYKLNRNFKWEFDMSYGTSSETSSALTTPVDVSQDDLNLSAGFIWDF